MGAPRRLGGCGGIGPARLDRDDGHGGRLLASGGVSTPAEDGPEEEEMGDFAPLLLPWDSSSSVAVG